MPKFECPHCSQRIEAPAESSGTESICPACGEAINVPGSKPVKDSDSVPETKGMAMMPGENPVAMAGQGSPPPPKSKKPPPVPSRPKTPPPHKKIPPPPPVSGVSKPSPAPPSSGKPTGGKRALGAVLAILLLLALCGGGFYFWQQNEKNKERLEKQRIAETEKAEKLEEERQQLKVEWKRAAALLAKAEAYCETGNLDEASRFLVDIQQYELTPEMKSQVGELRERIERDRRRLVQQKIEEAEIAKREAERAGTRAREEQETAARERQDMLTRQKADADRLREQENLRMQSQLSIGPREDKPVIEDGEFFVTSITKNDTHNSNGVRLTDPVLIMMQDRANVHRFGNPDGDDVDQFFNDAGNRARIRSYLKRGSFPQDVQNSILLGKGDRFTVSIYKNNDGKYCVNVSFQNNSSTAGDRPRLNSKEADRHSAGIDLYELIDSESNIREGPGTNYPIIRQSRKGESGESISSKMSWKKLQFSDGSMGWVHEQNLKWKK